MSRSFGVCFGQMPSGPGDDRQFSVHPACVTWLPTSTVGAFIFCCYVYTVIIPLWYLLHLDNRYLVLSACLDTLAT